MEGRLRGVCSASRKVMEATWRSNQAETEFLVGKGGGSSHLSPCTDRNKSIGRWHITLQTLEDKRSEGWVEGNGTSCIQVRPLLPTKTRRV